MRSWQRDGGTRFYRIAALPALAAVAVGFDRTCTVPKTALADVLFGGAARLPASSAMVRIPA